MTASALSCRLALLWCLALLLPACIDRYEPEAISSPRNFLVVDGFINSQGISSVKLSRTFPLSTKTTTRPPVERGATVFIESETGTRYRLLESVPGTYTSPSLMLTSGAKYRLHVTTAGASSSGSSAYRTETYASDYVAAKTTPPIESLLWRAEATGVGIYLNTRDPANATQYYRWEFEETWEIIPPHRPLIEYFNGRIQPIRVRYPTLCWGSEQSTAIQISKTTALSQDVVANFPLRQLPISSPRLHERYSILVQQHALSKAEYEYWEMLRKNTESIGSLFDPQPTQLTGNMHCLSTPGEVVLGFVGVHSVESKRLFIARPELPRDWRRGTGYEACVPPDTVIAQYTPAEQAFGSGNQVPINEIPGGWTASSIDCVDCRTRGTVVRPSFW